MSNIRCVAIIFRTNSHLSVISTTITKMEPSLINIFILLSFYPFVYIAFWTMSRPPMGSGGAHFEWFTGQSMTILPCSDFSLQPDIGPVSVVDYAQSKFKKHFRNIQRLKKEENSSAKSFFLDKTCTEIIKSDFLKDILEEGQFHNFLSLLSDLLPHLVSWIPSNVLLLIIDAADAEKCEWFLMSLRLSCLYHRLTSTRKMPSLIVILREAQTFLLGCRNHVIVAFTESLLGVVNEVTTKENEFLPLFKAEVNSYFGKLLQTCLNTLSCPSVSLLIQECLGEFDYLAPSPKAIIASPESCRVSGVLSISLLMGQLNAALIKLGEVRRAGQDELQAIHAKFPVQTKICLKYLLNIESFSRFNDDLVVLSLLERPQASEGKWLCTKEYATSAITGFLSDFHRTGRIRAKIDEIDLLLKQIIANSEFNALDPMLLVALLSQCTRILPVLMYKMEYLAFLAMVKLTTRVFEACFSIFEDSENLPEPVFRFIDLLLISPFISSDQTLTFAREIVLKSLLRLEPVFVHKYMVWLDFVATRGPCFASNYILSKIIVRNSSSYELFLDLTQQLPVLFRNSAKLLETMSYQALESVEDLWINVVSYIVIHDKPKAVSFAYMALKFVSDCCVLGRDSSTEYYCYFLRLFERLMKCPLFLITFCCFDVFLTTLLSDLRVFETDPGSGHCLLLLFLRILSRNGSNYDANVMFGYPSYMHLVSIVELCVLCVENEKLSNDTHALALDCLQQIADNKYCHAIVKRFYDRIRGEGKIFFLSDQSVETVADLQLQMNRLLPNKVKKVEIGFEIWRHEGAREWNRAQIFQYCKDLLRESCL